MMEHGINVSCVTIKEDNLHTPSGDVRNAKKVFIPYREARNRLFSTLS